MMIMLMSMLGFSKTEAEVLSFKEALEYTEAYNNIWGGKKNDSVDGLLMGMVGCGRLKRR